MRLIFKPKFQKLEFNPEIHAKENFLKKYNIFGLEKSKYFDKDGKR